MAFGKKVPSNFSPHVNIEPRVFADHYDRIRSFLEETHRVTAWIVLASVTCYAAAGVLLYGGNWVLATLVASGGYGLFRAFRPLSVHLARRRLSGREGYGETFTWMAPHLRAEGARRVVAELERRIAEARHGTHDVAPVTGAGRGAALGIAPDVHGEQNPGDDEGQAAQRRDSSQPADAGGGQQIETSGKQYDPAEHRGSGPHQEA